MRALFEKDFPASRNRRSVDKLENFNGPIENVVVKFSE